ncbi:MAG: hypothetical protein R3B49_01415 [Phycisphaerales bacterium]
MLHRWVSQLEWWWLASAKPWFQQLPPPVVWFVVVVACAILTWALFGETLRHAWRARRPWVHAPRRCPGCWYDMGGVPERRCPECGREAPTERKLHRWRRRRWIACLAVLVIAAGSVELAWLRWGEGRWIRHKPVEWVMPRLTRIDQPHDQYAFEYQFRVLLASQNDQLTDEQWREALSRTAFVVARPRASAADPVMIDVREPYWTTFMTIDVFASDGTSVCVGVTGYTPPAPDGSRTIVQAGPGVLTAPPPDPGQPAVVKVRAYHSEATVRGRLAWEGEIELAAPVEVPVAPPPEAPATPPGG